MLFLTLISNLALQAFFICMGVLGIGFLIGFHEFGHFIFCKLFNIETPTFSIGMGPKIFSKKIGGTDFMLSAIPLGGYVEIAGADDTHDSDVPKARQFSNKPYYQKMLVIAGGIIFNILFAYATLTMLFWTGMPSSPLTSPQYASSEIKIIEPGSPIAQAGLKPGDHLVAVDGEKFQENPSQVIQYIRNNPGKKIEITYQRNGIANTTRATLESQTIQGKSFGTLGIVEFVIPTYSFLEALKKGISATHNLALLIAQLFKKIFVKQDIQNLGGPLMVIQQTIKGAEKGIKMFLLILAFISINLAVLNILPLPIMDGGQALLYTIEAIMQRPLPETVKLYIKYACWIFFLLLAVALSVKDIFFLVFKK